jgi:hypothetical protein
LRSFVELVTMVPLPGSMAQADASVLPEDVQQAV